MRHTSKDTQAWAHPAVEKRMQLSVILEFIWSDPGQPLTSLNINQTPRIIYLCHFVKRCFKFALMWNPRVSSKYEKHVTSEHQLCSLKCSSNVRNVNLKWLQYCKWLIKTILCTAEGGECANVAFWGKCTYCRQCVPGETVVAPLTGPEGGRSTLTWRCLWSSSAAGGASSSLHRTKGGKTWQILPCFTGILLSIWLSYLATF